ncbi:MAG: efflux RND transporter periplasmic adaptor subunit [Verrucomicrobia bacterium]|nr:efflux RND transporter periplasmic adaptor subunit [Verrucomicrobiota bacterium]
MKKYIALAALLSIAGCEKAPPPPPPPHQVTVTTPSVCTVPLYLDYTGHVTPYISVDVMAQVSGILTSQFFEQGQDVKEGDLLLVIDPRPYEAQLAQAEGVLAQTYANLEYARDTTKRYASLVKENFISQLDYDQYVTNVLADEATIKQNQAAIETAKINLGYCFIRAPMNCVTGQLQVKPGNYINANSGTNLVTLNQIQPIYVDFYVPETDLTTIQMKQRAKKLKLQVFTEPSHTHSFEGELTLIDNQVNENTGAILMEGTFANEEKLLWPGHYVDVRVILDELNEAIVIPTQSVMVGQSGHYVYVLKSDSTAEKRAVQIGQRFGEQTVILAGVKADDQVIVEGQLNIYSGMKVQVATKAPPVPQQPAYQAPL